MVTCATRSVEKVTDIGVATRRSHRSAIRSFAAAPSYSLYIHRVTRARRLWLITKAVAKATWPLVPINLFSAFISDIFGFDAWGKVLVQSIGNVFWLVYEEWRRQSAAFPLEPTVRLERKVVTASVTNTVIAIPETKPIPSSSPRRRPGFSILKIAAAVGLLLILIFYVYLYFNAGANID